MRYHYFSVLRFRHSCCYSIRIVHFWISFWIFHALPSFQQCTMPPHASKCYLLCIQNPLKGRHKDAGQGREPVMASKSPHCHLSFWQSLLCASFPFNLAIILYQNWSCNEEAISINTRLTPQIIQLWIKKEDPIEPFSNLEFQNPSVGL